MNSDVLFFVKPRASKSLIKRFLTIIICLFFLAGCEETNLQIATDAGIDAVRALTLTDDQVIRLSRNAADAADRQNRVASPGSAYAERLRRLVGDHRAEGGYTFNHKVYLSPQVNAFAMGDGTIRVYSGLMDMMNDDELRFVIGHEMGHVVEKHVRRKMILALAGSAIRKGIASQENIIGELARSGMGQFLELLANAQFSQEEERSADDYALDFMKRNGYRPEMAVSALEKLAGSGNSHHFLSSHPAPDKRAERLRDRLLNPEEPETEKGLFDRAWDLIIAVLQTGYDWVTAIFARVVEFLG